MKCAFSWLLGPFVCLLAVGCSSSKSDSTTPDPSAAGSPATDGATTLSGTLGDLGKLLPTATSLVISNSGETLVYLSSATITCTTLSVSRWLGSIEAGAQVVEIVVKSSTTTGTLAVGGKNGAEVNYAKGGRSSSYEQAASSGSVTFTKNEPQGVVEGSFSATYASPTGDVSGTFHAEFCDGGQGY
jgi:hypothetical protein